jgi:VanZ family protein
LPSTTETIRKSYNNQEQIRVSAGSRKVSLQLNDRANRKMSGMSNAIGSFKYWIPAISAAAIISVFSTGAFGDRRTATYILPVLHWIIPDASPRLLHWLHTGLRKMAHIAEFGVFSILVFRGCRAGRQGWRPRWAIATLLIALGCASLDEIHQIFIPGSGPSIRDVAIDTVGAMLAQAMVWLYATGIWGRVAISEEESRSPGQSP